MRWSLCLLLAACASNARVDTLEANLEAMRAELEATRQNTDEARREMLEMKEELAKQTERLVTSLDALDKKLQERPLPSAPAVQAPRPGGVDPSLVYAIPLEDSPAQGAEDAWVTLVEISDFQCPFCARVQTTLTELRQQYGNDLRVVYKHYPLPFHTHAMQAALASECARDQGVFWEAHKLFFENQTALEDEKLEDYAKQTGKQLRMKEWKACFESQKHKARIERDMAMADRFGSRGTPGFFINGRFLSGAQPLESFKAIIDAELKRAKESGIPKKDYYKKAVLGAGMPGVT